MSSKSPNLYEISLSTVSIERHPSGAHLSQVETTAESQRMLTRGSKMRRISVYLYFHVPPANVLRLKFHTPFWDKRRVGNICLQHSRFDPIDTSQDYGLTCLLETFPQTVWAFQKTSASDESAFALTLQYLVRWTPLPTLSLNDTMKSLARYGRPMCCRSLTGQARFISCTSVLPTRALACAADSPLKMAASANACLHRYYNAKVLIKRPFHLPKRSECFASTRADD